MLIAVVKEITTSENRVALTPQHISILKEMGHTVKIETEAGKAAGFDNKDYQEVGTEICENAVKAYQNADVIFKIWAPLKNELSFLNAGQTIICNAQNIKTFPALKKFADKKINLFALDLMPRISRAQSMDILSSQNNLAGYAAVIVGAQYCPMTMPLMITSAGTLPPLKILIMGLGVAGLQAAATAHRLGAQLYAFDNRPETEEQAASIGAVFVHRITNELLSSVQMIITSALSFGKPAPQLLTPKQLSYLPKNCIIIDMSADAGGNVPANQIPENITLISDSHLARHYPQSASLLYSGNMLNFFRFLYRDNHPNIETEDEIFKATAVCFAGKYHHPFLTGK